MTVQFNTYQVSATRPSPVKAIFSQEELEVAALSLSQLLMTELLHPDTISEPSSKVYNIAARFVKAGIFTIYRFFVKKKKTGAIIVNDSNYLLSCQENGIPIKVTFLNICCPG